MSALRFAVRPIAMPEWVRRTHVSPLVRRCWCITPGAASKAKASEADSGDKPASANALLLHGTSVAGLRSLLLETPELCYESTHHTEGCVPQPPRPEPPLFASRTEKRDDVRVAETYASVANLMPTGGDEAALLESIERALADPEALESRPTAGAHVEGRRMTRAVPILQFEADLTGSQLASDGPMLTADGRVMFCEHDSDLASCRSPAEAPQELDAPVTYFIDTGMAFAVPWRRIRADSMRGLLLELASSE